LCPTYETPDFRYLTETTRVWIDSGSGDYAGASKGLGRIEIKENGAVRDRNLEHLIAMAHEIFPRPRIASQLADIGETFAHEQNRIAPFTVDDRNRGGFIGS
jgi:hypothetical protein